MWRNFTKKNIVTFLDFFSAGDSVDRRWSHGYLGEVLQELLLMEGQVCKGYIIFCPQFSSSFWLSDIQHMKSISDVGATGVPEYYLQGHEVNLQKYRKGINIIIPQYTYIVFFYRHSICHASAVSSAEDYPIGTCFCFGESACQKADVPSAPTPNANYKPTDTPWKFEETMCQGNIPGLGAQSFSWYGQGPNQKTCCVSGSPFAFETGTPGLLWYFKWGFSLAISSQGGSQKVETET